MTDEIDKKYFSMGEVSEMLNISQSSIRYYVGLFKIVLKKNRHGNRFFTEDDIAILKWICIGSSIYRLKIIEGAFALFPLKRFTVPGLLTATETKKIYDYFKSTTTR